MVLQAVLLDLHNTLVHQKRPLSSEEVSKFLLNYGNEVYPQSWDAASHYVFMIDYPKHGYRNRQSFLKQTLKRLGISVEGDPLEKLAHLQETRNKYFLFSDTAVAIKRVKKLGLRTAIVTTIPDFAFASAIEPIKEYFDIIMTGYKAGCEKSNPLMHRKTLEELNVSPNQAVMIGDEVLVDIKIPKSLGMKTILLDRMNEITKKPREADERTETLAEAVNIIEKWRES
jgi:HAD superfamily hydrolase (TIGR01549 family)